MTCNNKGWSLTALGPALLKRNGFHRQTGSWVWDSSVPGSRESTGCWAVWRVSQGMWSSPTTQHLLDHVCNTICSFGSPNTGKTSMIWSRFSRGHLDAQRPEHVACVEGLRDLGLVNHPWRRDGTPSRTCQQHNGDDIFTKVHTGKMTDIRHTLKQEKLSLNIWTSCPHGNRQAEEQVTQPSCAVSLCLGIFQNLSG